MGLISTDMLWESYYFASLLGVSLDTDTKEATIPLAKKKRQQEPICLLHLQKWCGHCVSLNNAFLV